MPSDKLSKLMPGLIGGGYVAKKLADPAHCVRAEDCWLVTQTFKHKAAAQYNNDIVASWAVDLGTMKAHALNTEAETLFVRSSKQ